MSEIINNREHRQTKLVIPFINAFLAKNKININISNSIIATTFNNIPSDIYVRLETHDEHKIETKLYIDVIDRKDNYIICDYYYHITWAALTFYIRNCDYDILLKPLKNIYNNKTKFCNYMFRNKTYKNAVKRYNFYQVLNSKRKVDHVESDKRYSLDMFDDAVEMNKPYKFTISFENNIIDGYITEKIINCFLAGSIPIYDGTDDIYKYFNRDSFINAKDFNSLEELADYIIKVDTTPELYNKYINACPTNIDKLRELFWWEDIATNNNYTLLNNVDNGFPGKFHIYLNQDKTRVYKKIKNNAHGNQLKKYLQNTVEFNKYQNILLNINDNQYIGEYTIKCFDIESDGSHKCDYIEGYRLDKICNGEITINDQEIINNMISKIDELMKCLNQNCKNIGGDWALHNLIYSVEENKIYNVDIEGFYTYYVLPWWANIDKINEFLTSVLEKLNQYNNMDNNMDKNMNENNVNKVLNIIKYVKSSGYSYSGQHIDIGYHSIDLDGKYYRGQRDCLQRLEYIEKEIDFNNKNVLDIGCCIGGMLFPLADKINNGIGLDFNYKNINAGTRIVNYKKISNLAFYQFDLDKEDINFIDNFYDDKIDIVFLFSMCMWLKKWKNVIDYIYNISDILLIETNGSSNQQLEQIQYVKSKYKDVKILYDKSLDDKGQHNRQLYLCKK